uniref:Zeta toxin domain-containing protein n=1 Tax=Kalanchoe fedtschenkoi TaxID=63787 RepID=A0A7N0UBV8_KALFE
MKNNPGVATAAAAATLLGLVAAASAVEYHRRKYRQQRQQQPINKIVPTITGRSESGHIGDFERFSHYVARQIGFEDPSECPQLCKLAYDYLRKSNGCEENIFDYGESVYVKLVEELDRCILAYFAYHWTHTSAIISQVLSANSEQKTKLKKFVLAATRKQRFERVMNNLKVTRVFSTLVEEMRAIGSSEAPCTDVMVPAAHSDRSPVLLFMGGGMGAGKSTVLKDIFKSAFWSGAAANAVVVEADAFKETDVIYRALSSNGHHTDMLQTAELVHQSSTDAAQSLLVTALNEGRDVIMDGTLAWIPFVEQTIAMARNVHNCRYRMGVGYKVAKDGTVTENYWEKVEENGDADPENVNRPSRKPYRIELAGVLCDAYLAVVRGIRRAIIMGRAVRVKSQLTSHKRFANAFPTYCKLVDRATLYCTNAVGGPPKMIALKEGDNSLLVDPDEYKWLNIIANLNENADSIDELYSHQNLDSDSGSVWNTMVQSPTRSALQQELKACIQKLEKEVTDTSTTPSANSESK